MLVIKGNQKIPMKKNTMGIALNRMYKSKAAQDFEVYLGWVAHQAMRSQQWKKTDAPIVFLLEVVFGDKRKRDVQNCFGCVCDALNGIVYVDDSQIVLPIATKRYEKGKWGFTITVRKYDRKIAEDITNRIRANS